MLQTKYHKDEQLKLKVSVTLNLASVSSSAAHHSPCMPAPPPAAHRFHRQGCSETALTHTCPSSPAAVTPPLLSGSTAKSCIHSLGCSLSQKPMCQALVHFYFYLFLNSCNYGWCPANCPSICQSPPAKGVRTEFPCALTTQSHCSPSGTGLLSLPAPHTLTLLIPCTVISCKKIRIFPRCNSQYKFKSCWRGKRQSMF